MQCTCGAEWFVEERLVCPAGIPRSPQHTTLPNRNLPHYRYRCADCGLIYGQEKPAEAKSPVVETENPQPKRRGRPPKNTQTEE